MEHPDYWKEEDEMYKKLQKEAEREYPGEAINLRHRIKIIKEEQ